MRRLAGAALVAVAIIASMPVGAEGGLPAGALSDKPRAWETETAQAGGQNGGQYRFVGSLRCKAPKQGIVGARVLHSQVVDQIQIGCAKVECSEGHGCTWEKLERGMFAGEAAAKSEPGIGVCPHDSVVAGYRARAVDDHVAELQLECARLALVPGKAAADAAKAGIPISGDERSWIAFAEKPPAGQSVHWDAEGHCDARGASGISVGVGLYKPSGNATIQALSLFCVRAPAAQPMSSIVNATTR